MTTNPTLRLEPMRVLWPQCPRGVAVLENDTNAPLRHVNEMSDRGCADLVVTSLDTGVETVHRRDAPLGVADAGVTLAPDEALRDAVDLGARAPLPGVGLYDVRARFRWEDGAADSLPSRVEVSPAQPRALALAMVNGGHTGLVGCAWIHEHRGRRALWHTLLSGADGRFLDTTELLAFEGAEPSSIALSQPPPGRPPSATRVAWIADGALTCVRRRRGEVHTFSWDTGLPGARLLGPLIDHAEGADGLMIGPADGGWWMQPVRLDDQPSLGDVVVVPGYTPSRVRTACFEDGRRHTILVSVRAPRADEPVTSLYALGWSDADITAPALTIVWPGLPRAIDHRALPDGTLAGAALLCMGLDARRNVHRHALQRWRVTPDGVFVPGALRWVDWPSARPVDRAVLRVDAEGNPFAVVQESEGTPLLTIDAAGQLAALPAMSAWPAEVFFMGGSDPAVLYTEPGTGLRVYGSAPIRPTISPAGAR